MEPLSSKMNMATSVTLRPIIDSVIDGHELEWKCISARLTNRKKMQIGWNGVHLKLKCNALLRITWYRHSRQYFLTFFLIRPFKVVLFYTLRLSILTFEPYLRLWSSILLWRCQNIHQLFSWPTLSFFRCKSFSFCEPDPFVLGNLWLLQLKISPIPLARCT